MTPAICHELPQPTQITVNERKMMNLFARLSGACLALVVGSSSFLNAQELAPVPEHPSFVSTAPTALFTNVCYKDLREMSPCAVEKIIRVNDPCACECECNCCEPKCVYIRICVPPCGCEEVTCRRDGDRVRYDYGKYAVDVRVKDGYIEVDYQD